MVYLNSICKYTLMRRNNVAIIILVKGGLESKLEHYETSKRLQFIIRVVTFKVTSCKTMWEKKEKKVKILHSLNKSNNLWGAISGLHINFGPKFSHMIVLEEI
jgi:predicted aspartyl protease